MGAAQAVISLSVRPYQVSHLCFEVDGIVETARAQLGVSVGGFDFTGFYGTLSSSRTVTGDPSLLFFNSSAIDTAVAPVALFTLRHEAQKAALNKAINSRQNAYFAKYANAPAIIAMMNQFYSNYTPPTTTGPPDPPVGSKLNILQALAGTATDQWNRLKTAYSSDPTRNPVGLSEGVVRTTNSALCSDTTSYGYSATGSITYGISATPVGVGLANTLEPNPPVPPGPMPPPSWAMCGDDGPNSPGGAGSVPAPVPPTPTEAPPPGWDISQFTLSGTNESPEYNPDIYSATTEEWESSNGKARQNQTIVNTDYGYRTPYYDAQAQYQRAQISLIDQQFAQFMAGQNVPNLARVFQNELNNIDADIYRLQIAYLSTIVISPIVGIVTGVYKYPGDAARAGEPVVRVEDNTFIFLAATVVYRGPIRDLPTRHNAGAH